MIVKEVSEAFTF